jgi:PD-(D/E)XK nuclease superfamily
MEGMMRLAQGHLKRLAECPRRFQYVVLQGEGGITAPEQQQRLDRGKQFHQVVEQVGLGLPIVGLEAPLVRWWQAFQAIEPQLATLGSGERVIDRAVELEQTLLLGQTVLVGVYDLLLLGEKGAEIIDWKTYAKPEDVETLRLDWQTRLYLYLLAENSGFAPENLAMTYWFLGGNSPQSWRLEYDATQHQTTAQDLETLLGQLNAWITDYDAGLALPQVSQDRNLCPSCPFSQRCDRVGVSQGAMIDRLDLIPERPL